MSTLATIVFGAALLYFLFRRSLRYARHLQQEFYYTNLYLIRVWQQRALDKRGTAGLLLTLGLIVLCGETPGLFIGSLILCGLARAEEDPRSAGKLRLALTARLRRTLALLGVIEFAFVCLALSCACSPLISVLLCSMIVQLLPLALAVANSSLLPVEQHIQNRYRAEAQRMFATIAPKTIGITGSFGKTSVKGILTALLGSTHSAVYAPPDGVNSLMGITRDIRERLDPRYRTAVIEMGAYHEGSIARLCTLTPPQVAVVTAVAPMHLDRFGSLEHTFRAKSELPNAVPDGGLVVLNGDNEGTRRMAGRYPSKTVVLYGLDPEKGPLDCCARDLRITTKGMTFELAWRDTTHTVTTPLLGQGAVSNILAAFTTAAILGADPGWLVGAIANLQPVRNRLELKTDPLGFTIHDAYNSNPRGFEDALWVLSSLPVSQRILMTPGMVELGEFQERENEHLAAHAATICDVVVVVGETNRAALMRGLTKAGARPGLQIREVATREAGFIEVVRARTPGSALLIENDLPDIYENRAYGY